MSTLSDILQAASNTAADTVSAPVDILAWLSRKAGIPVGNAPVGGSDWMRAQGLTRPVQQSAASLTGETLGLLSPIAAAAKAPQIARGLLAAGDNLAAPVARGPMAAQRGAIVYHGSPHKFDKFDASKIGTGEGAQAYGHGLYLAESPDVAKTYQALDPTVLAPPVRAFRGVELSPGSPEYHAATLLDSMGLQQARKTVANWIAGADPRMAREAEGWKKTLETLNQAASKADFKQLKNSGALYKVDLPDEAIARMLDWDKPLSQQAPEVQKALDSLGDMRKWNHGGITYPNPDALRDGGLWGAIERQLGKRQASEVMRAQGIPGIRYLDGGSRGAGTGTSNYVVFPGEEELLKIIERNGKGLLSP